MRKDICPICGKGGFKRVSVHVGREHKEAKTKKKRGRPKKKK